MSYNLWKFGISNQLLVDFFTWICLVTIIDTDICSSGVLHGFSLYRTLEIFGPFCKRWIPGILSHLRYLDRLVYISGAFGSVYSNGIPLVCDWVFW